MAILQNTAEGGSNGVTPTTSDTGSGDAFTTVTKGATAGILEYTNVSTMHGALAYRLATRGTSESNYLGYATGAAQDFYGRFYLAVDVIGTSYQFVHFRVSDGGSLFAMLFMTTANKMAIRDFAGVNQWTAAAALTTSAWYRVEWRVTSNNTTTVQAQVRYYLGDTTALIEDSGQIAVGGSVTINTWAATRYGINSAANIPSSTGFLYFDDVRAFDTTWPGPSVITGRSPTVTPLPIMSNGRI